MNGKKTVLLALIAACGLVLFSPRASAWQRTIGANAVALDANGDVVAAGPLAGQGYGVVKFSGTDGTERWRREDGTNTWSTVAVDANGDVVAGGSIVMVHRFSAFAVMKLSGLNGTLLWRQAIIFSPGTAGAALSIAVDPVGNVVAGGYTSGNLGDRGIVVKYAGANGAELWRQPFDSGNPSGANTARALKVDAAGDVVAAGVTLISDNQSLFTVVKFSGADGTELWRQLINEPGYGGAYAVAIDSNRDVVAAGKLQSSCSPFGSDFTVVKFSGADGTELWRQVECGGASAVAVYATGDVVAAGRPAAIRLSGADGTELWAAQMPTPDSDLANAVALDPAGDVVVGGQTWNGSLYDFAVFKFSGADGTELWRQIITGGSDVNSAAHDVAVDAAGNVVAVGVAPFGGYTSGYVVKLQGTDGSDF